MKKGAEFKVVVHHRGAEVRWKPGYFAAAE